MKGSGLSSIAIAACWLLAAGRVFAEAPNAAEQAKARWKEGASALSRGDAESARTAFAEAYALLPDAQLAQSLGEIEFRTGHFADAARHLTRALESEQLAAEERKGSTKSLQKARAKVGQLLLDVSVPGAELHIDGQVVQLSPFLPWYLDAGVHTITARKEGFLEATQEVTASPGQETHVSITLSPELNEDLFKPSIFPVKHMAPAPRALTPLPDRSNPPPARFFIAEGAVALAAVSAGVYFTAKPGADNTDKVLAGAFFANGAFIAAATVVLWLVTRPKPPAPPPQSAHLDPLQMRVQF